MHVEPAFTDYRARLTRILYVASMVEDATEVEALARNILAQALEGGLQTPAGLSQPTSLADVYANLASAVGQLAAAAMDLARHAFVGGDFQRAIALAQACRAAGAHDADDLIMEVLESEAAVATEAARRDYTARFTKPTYIPDYVGWEARAAVFEQALRWNVDDPALLRTYILTLTPANVNRVPYNVTSLMVTRIGEHVPIREWSEYRALVSAAAKVASYLEAEPKLPLDPAVSLSSHQVAVDRYWERGQPFIDACDQALAVFRSSVQGFVESFSTTR